MRKITAFLLTILLFFVIASAAFAQTVLFEDDFSGSDGWYEEMWQSGGSVQITVLDGESVASINSPSENDVRYCRNFDVEPNSFYKATCKVKTENVVGGNGANISVVNSYACSDVMLGTNDWTNLELVGQTNKDQTTLTLCLRIGGYSATASGTAWFDDFTFEKIEDATGLDVADFSMFTSTNSGEGTDQNQSEGADQVHPTAQEIHEFLSMFIAAAIVFFAIAFACHWFFIRPDSSVKKGRVLFGEKESCLPIILILFGAFALRAVLAGFITGFYFDVNCFTFWGARAADIPLANFYETWCDYPPGYIYVLALMSKIASGLGLTGGTAAHMFVIKLPAILCDLFAAYAVFRLAKKRMTKATAYVVTCFVAFSPVMAFISGAWAQIDSVLSILLFASAFLLCDRKIVWAGLVYGISIAVKPQALMVGPIYALVYIMYIIDAKSNKERLNIFLKTLAAVGSAVGMILLAFIPFFPIKGGEGLFDYAGRLVTEIYNKYFSTLGGYDYATIEAYNLFGLCGANWRPSGEMFILGLSYKQFGTLMMGISVVASWVLYIIGRKKSKYCIFLVMAFLLSSLFIFGHYMHERYLAPVLLLTVIAMCGYGDRRLFIAFAAFSAGLFVNVLGAYTIILPIVDGNAMRAGWGDNYTAFIRMGSVINLLAYIFFTYACVSLTAGNKIWGTAMPEPLKKSKNIKK